MKEIIFGMISGVVAALGMGGGTVLILLLGLFTNFDQHLIQGTNLIVFIPSSITAIFMNIKHKTIDYKLSKIFIIFGIFGAIAGCLLSFKFESKILKKFFGVFLIFIAFFEIFSLFKTYKKKSKRKY